MRRMCSPLWYQPEIAALSPVLGQLLCSVDQSSWACLELLLLRLPILLQNQQLRTQLPPLLLQLNRDVEENSDVKGKVFIHLKVKISVGSPQTTSHTYTISFLKSYICLMSEQQIGVEWLLRLTLLMLFSSSPILLSSCRLSVRVALWETWKKH